MVIASNRLVALLALAGIAGVASAQVVPVTAVPGKEYIAEFNINAGGAPTPGQVLKWDGFGNVANGVFIPRIELDAIANQGDAFFSELVNDQAAMIASFRMPSAAGGPGTDVHSAAGGPLDSLWYHESTPFGSGSGVWANVNQVDNKNRPENVIGVEVWGPDDDTNYYSEAGDLGGVAVWSLAGGAYLTSAELALAIKAPTISDLDLDALMVQDFSPSDRFDIGDRMIVSIRANSIFDGGEIWVLERDASGAVVGNFLKQGGHVWDTANDVQKIFGYIEQTEEIDGLEAMAPTPGALGLGAVAMLTLARRRRTA